MSKKRKREVDLELVKVYEELAQDEEDVRLRAAHNLVSKIFKPGVTSDDQTRAILTRLFRGACSGRKAARLGFSVALTELLSQLPLVSGASTESGLPVSTIVDILEAQTVPEGGTSRQDERDHHFGRVFGAGAVLKSSVLFKTPHPDQWKRVLGLIAGVALKKPWLRQECGWILLTRIASPDGTVPELFAIDTIEQLAAHKLIRTPEGVAIWLTTARLFPHAQLPKSVWPHGDPLARKDVNVLANLLKDARAQSEQTDGELELEGSARWSANLHFAWDVVLSELFGETANQETAQKGGHTNPKDKRVPFELFWKTVVDESLFASSSSIERKAWGFTVWRKVFEAAPGGLLQYTFTPNAMHCLVNSLKSSERFLQKHAMRVSKIFPVRFEATDEYAPGQGVTGACIRALLESVSYGDFDQITNSKTIHSLVDVDDERLLRVITATLNSLWDSALTGEDKKLLLVQQKTIINLQSKIVTASLRNAERGAIEEDSGQQITARSILAAWTKEICVSLSENTKGGGATVSKSLLADARAFMKERLTLGFEKTLRLGPVGARILLDTVREIHSLKTHEEAMATLFEADIGDMIQEAWQKLAGIPTSFGTSQNSTTISASTSKPSSEKFPTLSDGLCLLYCLVLFQIYMGEPDAVEILRDLLEYHTRWSASKKKGSSINVESDSSEAIVEILLSFASKPSKFLRRITIQIFDAFAPNMTSNSVQSLCRILAAKENAQGQQEMFQPGDIEMEDAAMNSDSEDLDSDVEVISDTGDSISGDDDSSASSEEDEDSADSSEDDDESGDQDDAELAAFDAALASALGTRRLDQNDHAADSDSDSSSDIDMNDNEMMELDAKLAEVFRARNEQQAKNKKKDAKDAKENVVNFKNRVFDLVESYLKTQQKNSLALEFIMPLLTLVRTTQTKQLADRGANILQQFFGRSKGVNVPDLSAGGHIEDALQILQSVHNEACLESSNIHSIVASQASILLVKALVFADPKHVEPVVQIYAATRMKQLTDRKCRVLPGFFTEWNNWCQSVRGKFFL